MTMEADDRMMEQRKRRIEPPEPKLRERPNDPVLDFIYDHTVWKLIFDDSHLWPYSRLSASRAEKIGYKLIKLRCAQIGVDQPTREEAKAWRRLR